MRKMGKALYGQCESNGAGDGGDHQIRKSSSTIRYGAVGTLVSGMAPWEEATFFNTDALSLAPAA